MGVGPLSREVFLIQRETGSIEPLPPDRIGQAWARLGHRDTSTTLKIYGHLMPGADARVTGIFGSALSRTSPVEE